MPLPTITIDGVSIHMPITHGWQPTSSLGVGGAGNVVLTAVWTYRMTWQALAPAEFKEIYDLWFDNQGSDVSAQLPELGANTYVLKAYTARMNPVTFRSFFEGHYLSINSELVGIDITA